MELLAMLPPYLRADRIDLVPQSTGLIIVVRVSSNESLINDWNRIVALRRKWTACPFTLWIQYIGAESTLFSTARAANLAAADALLVGPDLNMLSIRRQLCDTAGLGERIGRGSELPQQRRSTRPHS